MRLQFISQSKAETSFSLKKKRKKETKEKKKATMSPAFPSAWFMEMHLPIFFPPIIGKYSNKSENVRQFCYQRVGYPNTLSSEKPRDVTVTRRNITRVEGWPKKGGAINITIIHFQHMIEDHWTEMCSLLFWLYLDHSIFQIDFFFFLRNNACRLQTGFTTQRRKCNMCEEAAAGQRELAFQTDPVQCIYHKDCVLISTLTSHLTLVPTCSRCTAAPDFT